MSNKHFIPKGTIISGFAGIGKTTAALEYDNVIDLESSKFFFKLPDNLTIEEYEKLKGDNSRQINPNGLSEYVDAIIQAQKKYDYVLIAMFPDLIKELNDRQIDVQIVLPNINDKNYYKDRYQNRGNSDTWIKNMLTSWDSYLDPDSPDFITNGIKLKNPIKEPIILNTLCYDSQKPYNPYTKKMLIDRINELTNSDSETLDNAINNLMNYRKERGLTTWTIDETYIEISNDDIVGNIKPDNSFTNTLELGQFKNVIDDDSYIVREFSTLNDNQKRTICEFIDKHQSLLEEVKMHLQFAPEIVKQRYIDIINDSIYELFLAIDYNETQLIIPRMDIFNNMDIEKLIGFLNETIENFTVKQLLSPEEFEDPISKGFWLKIIEENKLKIII